MPIKVTPAVQHAGESVSQHAGTIRQIGDDMFAHLRNLMSNGQLRGEGIAAALEASQQRWNTACTEFAQAETDFGNRTVDSYVNTIAADHRGAGFF